MATSIAESSVTIPNVGHVIDLCRHLRVKWDRETGMSYSIKPLAKKDRGGEAGWKWGCARARKNKMSGKRKRRKSYIRIRRTHAARSCVGLEVTGG